MEFLARIIADGSTGRLSSKRFGLVLTVTVLAVVMGGLGGVVVGVVWARWNTPEAARLVEIAADALVVLAGLVLTAVAGSYVGGKAVERRPAAGGEP